MKKQAVWFNITAIDVFLCAIPIIQNEIPKYVAKIVPKNKGFQMDIFYIILINSGLEIRKIINNIDVSAPNFLFFIFGVFLK